MTFSGRLATGTFFVVTVALAILLWRAERALRRDLEVDVQRQLERNATLVLRALPTGQAELQHVVRKLSLDAEIRITVISATGVVLADSDFPEGPLGAIENHLGRPEVQAALAGSVGHAKRHSATVGRDFMYVAIRGGPGVVRVAEDLERVDAIVHRSQWSVAGATALALVVGLCLALLAARSVSRPIIGLADAARSIAAGHEPRYPRPGTREIDVLVRALRDMHQQIEQRIAELRREQADSATILAAMAEGVIRADARGRVTTANVAARRILGYEGEDPMPDLAELFRAPDAHALVQAALEGTSSATTVLRVNDRTVELSAHALPEGGAVLVVRDITTLRNLETVRRDFVANVSHELKTPLTSIAGYTETVLTDDLEPATRQRFLEIVLANARRMQHLVDDLLDLSRIESGRWQPAPEEIDPAVAAREAWAGLGRRAAESGVALHMDVGPGLTARLDPDAARQILTNLFDNALRHTPRGGQISLSARADAGGVLLAVSDTGSGISQEHLPRIFERFYRADPSRARAIGGTGLGLAIVRHLIESHGGRVWAESELGHGTTIGMWVP
ncbi:MAG TPA: ATP-binding protein [Gemmatimonadales bacterium]|nr:ATP-binding protein [Gemmatimonadales bacterium]